MKHLWLLAPIPILLCLIDIHLPIDHNIAKLTAKRQQIQSFHQALEAFKTDTGSYPTEAEGVPALRHPMTRINWRGPYLSTDIPTDPWNTPYHYTLSANNAPLIE
jgi:general secretion pathway protein G